MSTFSCPHCGGSIKAIPLSGGGAGHHVGGWQSGRSFAMGAAPAGAEYSRETPKADLSGLEAGVKTPLAQAAITATVMGLLVILGVVFKAWPWVAIPTAWVITFALAWWVLLLNTRGLLKTVERVIGKDLDGDGAIGFSVEITLPPSEGKKMLFANFPGCRPEHVKRFARVAVDGKPTSEGAGLSRTRFVAIREESLRRGLVRWRDPEYHTTGLETTSLGRAAFQSLLDGLLD